MNKHNIRNPTVAPEMNIGRRDFLKASSAVALAPMILTSRKGGAQIIDPVIPPSPPTRPWREELPNAIAPLEQVDSLSPTPTGAVDPSGEECGRANHQRWAEFSEFRLYRRAARISMR